MSGYRGALLAVFLLAACDGNPFAPPAPEPVGDTTVSTLPGTTAPRAGAPISRYETFSADGNGYVKDTDISYDADNDEFHVNNIAFDGNNTYRSAQVTFVGTGKPSGTLGDFAVYESVAVPGDQSPTLQYRALRGVSSTGATQFAVVRSGAFTEYGFGGFVLSRNGSVVLPTTGRAMYEGSYSGLRDFSGQGGLEYVTGTMELAIDFDDFDQGAGVVGTVRNRQIFDIAGNNITDDFLTALAYDPLDPLTKPAALPILQFYLGPGTMDKNGELEGNVRSQQDNGDLAASDYEDGKYYAILAGDNASEVVGIIVVTSTDPRLSDITARETGGFVLYQTQITP
jgi:hypothetical protein